MLDALSPTTKPILPAFVIMGALGLAILNGIVLAGSQSLILLMVGRQAGRWFIATLIGVSIGWSLGLLLVHTLLLGLRDLTNWHYGDIASYETVTLVIVISAALTSSLVGLVVGICQSWVLRKWLQGAWRWILASCIGWLLAGTMYWLVYAGMNGPFCQAWNCEDQPLSGDHYQVITVSWIVGGIIVGVISGVMLKFLLEMRVSESISTTKFE